MKDLDLIQYLQGHKKKTIIIAAAALIVAVIIIVCVVKYKDIKGLIVDKKANQDLIDQVNEELNAENISLTQLQLQAIVSKLVSAMDGWGTNEKKIYAAFEELNSRSDVLQLIKTFGVKDGQNLNEWLHDDLNATEIAHINEILASKNINYKF